MGGREGGREITLYLPPISGGTSTNVKWSCSISIRKGEIGATLANSKIKRNNVGSQWIETRCGPSHTIHHSEWYTHTTSSIQKYHPAMECGQCLSTEGIMAWLSGSAGQPFKLSAPSSGIRPTTKLP